MGDTLKNQQSENKKSTKRRVLMFSFMLFKDNNRRMVYKGCSHDHLAELWTDIDENAFKINRVVDPKQFWLL